MPTAFAPGSETVLLVEDEEALRKLAGRSVCAPTLHGTRGCDRRRGGQSPRRVHRRDSLAR